MDFCGENTMSVTLPWFGLLNLFDRSTILLLCEDTLVLWEWVLLLSNLNVWIQLFHLLSWKNSRFCSGLLQAFPPASGILWPPFWRKQTPRRLIHSNTESANLFKRSRAYDLPSQRSLKNFWLNWTSKGSHLSTGKPGDYFILVIAFCRKLSKILVSFPRLHEPFVFSVFNVMSLLATLLTHTFLISVWSLKIP